jgi:fructokinase
VASGPALQARLGVPATDLTDDDPAWLEQARIVASGVHNLTCVLSPQMVIIGGGVGSRDGLHCLLPDLVQESLGGYLPMPRIVKPALGSDAGVIGALTLAQMA